MNKLTSVIKGATSGEAIMLVLSSFVLVILWAAVFSAPSITVLHLLVLYHAASLVYWVYRASALRQGDK